MAKPNYELIVNNLSNHGRNFIIFLEVPEVNQPIIEVQAWMQKYIYNGVKGAFKWDLEYGFVWTQVGIDTASQQIVPTNLNTDNQITLDYDPENQAFYFSDQEQGAQRGNMYIQAANNIPADTVSVGMALSGHPAVLHKPIANSILILTPRPAYWLVYADKKHEGPIDERMYEKAMKVVFPPNVYSLTATLSADDTWSIMNTPLRAEQPED